MRANRERGVCGVPAQDTANKRTPRTDFDWSLFGLGCISGVVLSVLCLCAVAVSVIALSLSRPGGATRLSGEPDASAEVRVEADGCRVTRTEVQGTTPVSNLQWVVIDESGERVLSRAAEGEYQYTYYRPGAYRVHLIAWYAGEYRQISNEVLIRCD